MRSTKRAKLAEWIAQHQPSQIDIEELAALKEVLAPVSENYLKKLLRESGVPLAPVVDGVRQSNLDELESSLLALLAEYKSGDAMLKREVRKLVITAKDHARWTHKEENLLWLTTWLENPPLFPAWVRLRREILAADERG
ncbi:MAG TPA: hypothetical protein VMT15_13195 [Bryobacteraceae bacterium]|nr:hypothetical protein [Bryobacteraceae bacterium]